jgi:hypothetical protein
MQAAGLENLSDVHNISFLLYPQPEASSRTIYCTEVPVN